MGAHEDSFGMRHIHDGLDPLQVQHGVFVTGLQIDLDHVGALLNQIRYALAGCFGISDFEVEVLVKHRIGKPARRGDDRPGPEAPRCRFRSVILLLEEGYNF